MGVKGAGREAAKMKTRKESVKFIKKQFGTDKYFPECSREKGEHFHYGKQELRELMDFIFIGPPKSKDEEI